MNSCFVPCVPLFRVNGRYVIVPRLRGQQLKEVDQLDGWLRNGSAAYLESLCEWGPF